MFKSSDQIEVQGKIINPWEPMLDCTIFKNSDRIAKETQLFNVAKINWLMMLTETIVACK